MDRMTNAQSRAIEPSTLQPSLHRPFPAMSAEVIELHRPAGHNEASRDDLARAPRRMAEDHVIRRLRADLHDGPAQLISLALLKVEDLFSDSAEPLVRRQIDSIRETLRDAMTEVRGLCTGSSMSEVQALPLREALNATIRNHERHTGTVVGRELDVSLDLPDDATTALCRFVQEGLNNAFRHAHGKDQRVTARLEDGTVVVEVEDGGPGIDWSAPCERPRLGLAGMRDRIHGVGGHLDIINRNGGGTLLRARLPLAAGGKSWAQSR